MWNSPVWSGRAAETLRCVCSGRPQDVPFGQSENWVDEWNEREYEARKDRSFTEARAEWARNHESACEALDETPEEKLNEKVRDRTALEYFAGDTYEHYREHAAHIRDWRQQLDTSED